MSVIRQITVKIKHLNEKFNLDQKILEHLAKFIGNNYPKMVGIWVYIRKEDYHLLNACLGLEVDLSVVLLAELKKVAGTKNMSTDEWAVKAFIKDGLWRFRIRPPDGIRLIPQKIQNVS